MNNGRTEEAKKALLGWHERLLPEAYRRRSIMVLSSHDAQRLVDDLLDAALALEEQKQIAESAMKSLRTEAVLP